MRASFNLMMILLLTCQSRGQLQPPTTRVTDCTDGGCHAAEVGQQFLHGPVAVGACETCHVYADEASHQFAPKRTGAQMCSFCHIGKTDTGGLHVHEPVMRGECLSCHDPHGSAVRTLLRGRTSGEMCLTCHEPVATNQLHVHTPVNEGDCLSCHEAHSSMAPNLLREQGRTLCLKCHVQIGQLPPQGAATGETALVADTPVLDPEAAAAVIHEPVTQDCIQCHDPHASGQQSLLTQSPLALCSSCHKQVAQTAVEAEVVHSVVTDGRACLHCHVPHSSNVRTLLKDHAIKVCLECHAKDVHRDDGSIVAGVAELEKPGYRGHGPAQEGKCHGCHNPHGAPLRSLLTRPYTQSFYQAYDAKVYTLCFSCHAEELVEGESGTGLTGFRHGDRNLHWVHVNQEKGRTCRACHEVHASKRPFHIREAVPFGEWMLRISFEQTGDGGTCSPGCHKTRNYNRSGKIASESSDTAAGAGGEP